MSDEPKPRETQSELFEQFSSTAPRTERFPSVSRTQKPILFSTNTEQLLMAGILSILALCLVFFLGVVRGKGLSSAGEGAPAAAVETAARLAPVPAQAPAQAVRPSAVSAPSIRVQPAQTAVPQAAPAARTPQAVPEASSKPYTIQIVTHRKKELAEAEMNGLRTQGFYSFIIPSGEYFQVCAGQYASKEEAKKDLARFQAKFKDCFLRRR